MYGSARCREVSSREGISLIYFMPLKWSLVFLSCLLCFQAVGQFRKGKGKSKESIQLQFPEVNQNAIKLLNELDFQQKLVELRKTTDSLIFNYQIDLRKAPSILAEDTASVNVPTYSVVEVSEQLKIDCLWVTTHEHFQLWDSKKINIYDFDVSKFKDSLAIVLYDSLMDVSWHPPIKGTKITSPFGFRGWRWHYGSDLKLNTGDDVYAVWDGIVRIRQYDRYGYGYYLVIRHKNGLETLYGHLSKMHVNVGEEVKAGQVIGLGGSTGRSTGPHLHFEIRYQGVAINPTEMFDFDSDQLLTQQYLITPKTFEYINKVNEIVYYRVKRGDTLSGIASRHRVSVNRLLQLNKISRNSILRIGQRIRIN